MSANGRVCVGFSHPVVAKYAAAGGNVTFSDGMILARGVEVSLSVDASDGNEFYADGVVTETDGATFTGGTLKLTVDGLHPEAEDFILGVPASEEITFGESKVKLRKFGSANKPPYVGIGVVIWYQSDGVEIFVPAVYTKGKFKQPGQDAKTQEGKKNWQTQGLEAALHRDDSSGKNWKWVGDDCATEAEAIAILHQILAVKEAAA